MISQKNLHKSNCFIPSIQPIFSYTAEFQLRLMKSKRQRKERYPGSISSSIGLINMKSKWLGSALDKKVLDANRASNVPDFQ